MVAGPDAGNCSAGWFGVLSRKLYVAVLLGPPVVVIYLILASNALGMTALKLPAAGPMLAAFAMTFVVHLLLNTEESLYGAATCFRMQVR
ncbi:MAG: hypothetical protein U1F23_09495 [Lysobacterales bacterium]